MYLHTGEVHDTAIDDSMCEHTVWAVYSQCPKAMERGKEGGDGSRERVVS